MVRAQLLSPVRLLRDPMDCGPTDSSVLGVSRQEHWSGLPFPSPGDPPDPGTEPGDLLRWQVDSSPLSHLGHMTYCSSCTEFFTL